MIQTTRRTQDEIDRAVRECESRMIRERVQHAARKLDHADYLYRKCCAIDDALMGGDLDMVRYIMADFGEIRDRIGEDV